MYLFNTVKFVVTKLFSLSLLSLKAFVTFMFCIALIIHVLSDIRWKAEDLVNHLLQKQDKGEALPPDSPRALSPVLKPKFDCNFFTNEYLKNLCIK